MESRSAVLAELWNLEVQFLGTILKDIGNTGKSNMKMATGNTKKSNMKMAKPL